MLVCRHHRLLSVAGWRGYLVGFSSLSPNGQTYQRESTVQNRLIGLKSVLYGHIKLPLFCTVLTNQTAANSHLL